MDPSWVGAVLTFCFCALAVILMVRNSTPSGASLVAFLCYLAVMPLVFPRMVRWLDNQSLNTRLSVLGVSVSALLVCYLLIPRAL